MKFQPVIKWSGSKRSYSEEIIKYIPKQIDTYYEPFCGSCSIMYQLLNNPEYKIKHYVCSDINSELINYFSMLKKDYMKIYNEYKKRWEILTSKKHIDEKKEYYNYVRQEYNRTKNIFDFIFLSRTSINGLIRYNSKGEFNASFHCSRNGINPEKFKIILSEWSNNLNNKDVQFINCSYDTIISNKNDYVFLDPPYANTTGMYFGPIDLDNYWNWLRKLNCQYSFTFDGKRDNIDNTYNVPSDVYTKHIYLSKKISGFNKIHGNVSYVKESLYIK